MKTRIKVSGWGLGLALCALTCGVLVSARAAIITQWTFEELSATPDSNNSTTTNGILPTIGTGFASGFHASSASDWSSPTGNGSSNSLSVNTWTNGDYFQFQTATTGYTNLSLYWDQARSGTGPATFDLSYSLNGSTFTVALNNYTVSTNAGVASWIGATTNVAAYATTRFTVDLSAITALEDATNVYFRVVNDTASAALAGTGRVDNFTLSGDAIVLIPEPTAAIAVLGAVFAAIPRRRRAS